MIIILADTSALVSLEIKGLVSQALKLVQFIISKAVYDELCGIAKFEDVHGRSAKDLLRLVEDGVIAVKSVFLIPEHLNNIDIGEAEILSLAGTCKCDYVITDDVRALPYMKSVAEVKVLTSAFVIRLLYDAGVLSREDALSSIKEIAASRDWYGGVLEVIACEYFDEKLDNPM
ncbi:MAG: hypothetical protein U9N46_03830 [Euryarchaeota archaeon]|nr:hypothetical protein [Euryarchaeota archaeon]